MKFYRERGLGAGVGEWIHVRQKCFRSDGMCERCRGFEEGSEEDEMYM